MNNPGPGSGSSHTKLTVPFNIGAKEEHRGTQNRKHTGQNIDNKHNIILLERALCGHYINLIGNVKRALCSSFSKAFTNVLM